MAIAMVVVIVLMPVFDRDVMESIFVFGIAKDVVRVDALKLAAFLLRPIRRVGAPV